MAYGEAMKIAREQDDTGAMESIETAVSETRGKMVVTEVDNEA